MIGRIVASVVAALATTAPTPVATWDANVAATAHADQWQSVPLPSGDVLWTIGDAVMINGQSTSGAYGYPHQAFVRQTKRTQTFTGLPGPYGYGYQQVPNWDDGSYFWAVTPVVDGSKLYIFGARISGAGDLTVVVGPGVAVFDAYTLKFQQVVMLPGTTLWGGFVKTTAGFFAAGTRKLTCYYATDCFTGDVAYIPFGQLANLPAWSITPDAVPSSANIGSGLALAKTSQGYAIFTKQGDEYGGTSLERLNASTVAGPWTVTASWPLATPNGGVTYGAAVHTEQHAPSGQILLNYIINGSDVETDYHGWFMYLPLT